VAKNHLVMRDDLSYTNIMKNELPKISFTSEEKSAFHQLLMKWYGENQRTLPWRSTPTPYRVWVSEAMLQQTQVATVIPYFERFMEQFPDVHTLASAESGQVLKLWEGLGYYSRARNLHRAAQLICEMFDGRIPADEHSLRKLPGVGPYIAAAVLSIAFQKPYAVVDGNVKRVLARFCGVDFPVNHPQAHKYYQPLADALLSMQCPGDYNQAMMELGALVCSPQQPSCGKCPVTKYCRAYQTRRQTALPVTIKRPKIRKKQWLTLVIRREEQLLLGQRNNNGLLGGLWQFPTLESMSGNISIGKVRKMVESLYRLPVLQVSEMPAVQHAFTHFKVSVQVYEVVVTGEVSLNNDLENYRWMPLEKVKNYPLSKIHMQILQYLMQKAVLLRN
jgi:A/G-specific adenine glycosylase